LPKVLSGKDLDGNKIYEDIDAKSLQDNIKMLRSNLTLSEFNKNKEESDSKISGKEMFEESMATFERSKSLYMSAVAIYLEIKKLAVESAGQFKEDLWLSAQGISPEDWKVYNNLFARAAYIIKTKINENTITKYQLDIHKKVEGEIKNDLYVVMNIALKLDLNVNEILEGERKKLAEKKNVSDK